VINYLYTLINNRFVKFNKKISHHWSVQMEMFLTTKHTMDHVFSK